MNKVWLITGSSKGLGRAITTAALENGDNVVATARQVEQLNELTRRFGKNIALQTLDVRDSAAAENAVAFAVDRFGRIDVLVNNAGYGTIGALEDTSIEDFRSQIETNLMGTVHTTKAAIPFMRKQGAGHIIQFSSVGGRIGALGRTPYSAAKWGVEGFSEALASEVGPLGIKVTIIEPGGFRTDFAADSVNGATMREEYQATVGAAARFQAEYHGNQPGDPARAAKVLIELSKLADPPLRLPLGSDALKAIGESDRKRLAGMEMWRGLSASTDYPTD